MNDTLVKKYEARGYVSQTDKAGTVTHLVQRLEYDQA